MVAHGHMVSVRKSWFERIKLSLLDNGVKVNGQYFRAILPNRNLLPDINYQLYFMFHVVKSQSSGSRYCRSRGSYNSGFNPTKCVTTQ